MKKKNATPSSPGAIMHKGRRYIPDPSYDTSKEAEETFLSLPWTSLKDYESTFPKTPLPEHGAWVLITDPPVTQYTVPPFSIFFATPWPFEHSSGIPQPKRAKIITPAGELGVFPHEYSIVNDIATYLGRESEGILVHEMNGDPVVDRNQLHYFMSRGIRRIEAMKLLIAQIKDPTWMWFEIAPSYGEFFGKKWPSESRCPFATPAERWSPVDTTAVPA